MHTDRSPWTARSPSLLLPGQVGAAEPHPEAAPEGVGSWDRGCSSTLASLRHPGQGPRLASDALAPGPPGLRASRSLPRPLFHPLGIPPGPPVLLTSQRANVFIHSLKLNLPIFHYQIPSWCHLPHAGMRLSFTEPEINIRCL